MERTKHPMSLEHIAGFIRATPWTLRSELSTLPRTVYTWHPGEGEWCINEVIGHMIEADRRGFDGRIRAILAEDNPALPGWNPPEVAARRRDCERDLVDLLVELTTMRATSADLVAALDEDQLQRHGQHEQVGELTIHDLIHEWVFHDYNHIKQIFGNVQAYVWPMMGNAQRFSELEF